MQHMGDTFKQVAMPALALGAGTGALSGYLSSRKNDPMESSRDRRHRILRNALVGAALGGTAGMALPMGYTALTTPAYTHTAGPVEGGIDSAMGFAGRNALPLGVAGLGGAALVRNRDVLKGEATEHLGEVASRADKARFMMSGKGGNPAVNTGAVSSLAATPEGAADMARFFRKGLATNGDPDIVQGDMGSIFRANELMQEAGHKGMSLKDMIAKFQDEANAGLAYRSSGKAKARLADYVADPNLVRKGFLQHMTESGPVAGLLARLGARKTMPFAETLAKIPGLGGLAKMDPVLPAELYSRFVRPSVGRALTDRWPVPLKLGLLGAGVLGANEVQNRLVGK